MRDLGRTRTELSDKVKFQVSYDAVSWSSQGLMPCMGMCSVADWLGRGIVHACGEF